MSDVSCLTCQKIFYVKPSHLKRGEGKYCSKACQFKSQFKGKVVFCSICNKEIYRSPASIKHSESGKFFCSKSCQTCWRNKRYIGEKSKNWKNGIKAYRNILKRSGKAETCLLCNNTDKRVLAVHHIDHQRTNNRLENLAWLCFNCHYLVHHNKELDRKVKFM